MAGNLIAVLAASGLMVAGAPNVVQTRAADAMPVARAALVQAAPARAAGLACFVPLKGGKIASLSDFRKVKAAGRCVDTQATSVTLPGFGAVPYSTLVPLAGTLAVMGTVVVTGPLSSTSSCASSC